MEVIKNIFHLKCPRCRQGHLFTNKNHFKWKGCLKMNTNCSACDLKFELENGFWWGTGYINYILTVLISAMTCLLWYLFIKFKIDDYSVLWWLLSNALFVIIIQPWIMRIGRSLYIHCFISYDSSILK